MMNVFLHIGLAVKDMERSRRFYEGVFGFEYDRELALPSATVQPLMQIEPPSDFRAVYMTLGPVTLQLMEWRPATIGSAAERAFNHAGLTHFSIAVDDVGQTSSRVAELGGSIVSALGRAAVIRDPDGQLIEVSTLAVYESIERGRAERAASRVTS